MDPKRKADDYHGMALYLRASKDVPVNGQRVLKFDLTFEETLKLSVAVQSCAMSLNEWNRRESTGKNMGLRLSFYTHSKAVTEPLDPRSENRNRQTETLPAGGVAAAISGTM